MLLIMTDFVTDKDITYLKNKGVDYHKDIVIFLKEIKNYFNSVWKDTYKIEELESIQDLNKKYLLDYPSWGGYYILEDSFSGSHNIIILSNTSIIILKYFYDISIRC